MNIGKSNRLKNIFRSNGRAVILPIDHGLTYGPISGIDRLGGFLGSLAECKLDAIVAQKGVLQKELYGGRQAQIVHISGSTSLSGKAEKKVLVGSVEDAIRLGASAVSVHINIGSSFESRMLKDLGVVSSQCEKWGMPLLAMMYLTNQNGTALAAQDVSHIARIAAELGADFVKVPYTGAQESFQKVVSGCFVPVLIAGGDTKGGEQGFFRQVRDSVDAGGAGLCVGRHAFQSQSPSAFIAVLERLVHYGLDAKSAFEMYLDLKNGGNGKKVSSQLLSHLEVIHEYSQ